MPTRGHVKALLLGAATYGVIVNTALLFSVLAPIYVLRGPVSGFVSVVTYNIVAFGKRYISPALDMASFLSIIVITASTLNVIAGLAVTYATLRKGKVGLVVAETLMASSLTLLISLGTLSGIRRIVSFELAHLTRNYGYVASAGRVVIYGVHAYPTPASLIFKGLTYAAVTIPYVILATVAYVMLLRVRSEQSAEPSK